MTEKAISKLSDSELDSLLLAKVEKRWLKVARIVGDVMFALDALKRVSFLGRVVSLY